jgi:hypothetical protein
MCAYFTGETEENIYSNYISRDDNFNMSQKASAQIIQWKVSSSPISNKAAVTKFQIYAYLSLLRHHGVFCVNSTHNAKESARFLMSTYCRGFSGSERCYFRIPAQ